MVWNKSCWKLFKLLFGFILIIYFCLVLQKPKRAPKPLLGHQSCFTSMGGRHNLVPGLHSYRRGPACSIILPIKHEKYQHNTCLSKHTWSIKNEFNINISWSIAGRAPPYNPISKSCKLCLPEKNLIITTEDKNPLNERSELMSSVGTMWSTFSPTWKPDDAVYRGVLRGVGQSGHVPPLDF